MRSARPNQRPNARVSACIAALVTHRILECGLADRHIDVGRDPVPNTCEALHAPTAQMERQRVSVSGARFCLESRLHERLPSWRKTRKEIQDPADQSPESSDEYKTRTMYSWSP